VNDWLLVKLLHFICLVLTVLLFYSLDNDIYLCKLDSLASYFQSDFESRSGCSLHITTDYEATSSTHYQTYYFPHYNTSCSLHYRRERALERETALGGLSKYLEI